MQLQLHLGESPKRGLAAI